MNAVIAELVLFAKRPGEEPFKVTLQIGTPYKSLDDPEEWACPVVVGPLYKHLPDVYGTDSMQALCLAVSLVLKSLQAFRDDGGTLSSDGSGDDFPLEAYFSGLVHLRQAPGSPRLKKSISALSDDELDVLLMAQVKKAQRKVALVIGLAMSGYDTWDEERVGRRIISLVESGKVEAFGDVRKWRFSEIRLPAE